MNESFILRAYPDSTQDTFIARALIVTACFIALLGLWAAIAKVPEVAKTRGEVSPIGGDIHVIQSLSGGKILRAMVEEGDVVKKGQAIAQLDQAVTEADIRKLDVKHSDFMMRIERLRALEQQRQPDFGAEGKQHPEMAREQLELYKSQAALMTSKLKQIDDELAGKKSDLKSTQKQLGFISDQLASIKKEVTIYEKGTQKGLTSQQQLLEKQEKLSELEKDQEALSGKNTVLKGELAALESKRKSQELDLQTQYRTDRSELVEQLHEVEQELIQAHTALGQNALVASEDGIIKSIPGIKVGSVIQPGGVIAELVPSNQPLAVEVQVSPRDIGFIATGQEVLIKVDAFDFSRFGAIKGEVIRVSPATFKDERTGQPYFKAYIQPQSEFVGELEKGRRIKVGMTVEADITTGYKTIFQYLLKPVYTTIDTALTER